MTCGLIGTGIAVGAILTDLLIMRRDQDLGVLWFGPALVVAISALAIGWTIYWLS